jgi:hypothetical protein
MASGPQFVTGNISIKVQSLGELASTTEENRLPVVVPTSQMPCSPTVPALRVTASAALSVSVGWGEVPPVQGDACDANAALTVAQVKSSVQAAPAGEDTSHAAMAFAKVSSVC